MLEEDKRHIQIDQALTHEDRDADRTICINYSRTVSQWGEKSDSPEYATVRMPHWGDESHLWRVQRKVLRERQPGLEYSTLTVA